MNEWIPARTVPAHGVSEYCKERSEKIAQKIIRVRPLDILEMAPFRVQEYRDVGCLSTNFWEVHPDDVDGASCCCCEHEILTD